MRSLWQQLKIVRTYVQACCVKMGTCARVDWLEAHSAGAASHQRRGGRPLLSSQPCADCTRQPVPGSELGVFFLIFLYFIFFSFILTVTSPPASRYTQRRPALQDTTISTATHMSKWPSPTVLTPSAWQHPKPTLQPNRSVAHPMSGHQKRPRYPFRCHFLMKPPNVLTYTRHPDTTAMHGQQI